MLDEGKTEEVKNYLYADATNMDPNGMDRTLWYLFKSVQ